MKTRNIAARVLKGLAIGVCGISPALAQNSIDNSALAQAGFREHKATYGLVYRLPKEATELLEAKINGPLKDKLIKLGLAAETGVSNIPHVTVVHIHSADPGTPAKMLAALPKLPPVLQFTFKTFYTTEAAKGAGHPWWFDLGIVKSGAAFESMMAFNTSATAALTPLRDGPLPRCTGPVYAAMSSAAKELVQTVGVSGVNVVKDGTATRSHNPHNTLIYSMAKFDAAIQAPLNQLAEEFNNVLPDGFASSFKDVSIVEIGFAGNVLREFYRVSLDSGAVTEVATGKTLPAMAK